MKEKAIRKGLRFFQWYYFCYWGMSAVIVQYLGVYYSHLGFDGLQIGVLNSWYSISGVIIAIIFGFIADKFGAIRLLLCTISLIGFISVFSFSKISNFSMLIIPIIGFACCMFPANALIDEQVIRNLGNESSKYSMYRKFGPIGFAVGSVISSWMISRNGINSIFHLFYGFNAVLLLLYLFLPISRTPAKIEKDLSFIPSLKMLSKNKIFYYCMLFLLFWGICEAGMYQFFHLLVISKGMDVSLTGWLSAASMAGEFTAYLLVVRLLNKKTNPYILISCAFFFMIVHYFGIIVTNSSGILLVLRFIGGAGFAFIWSPITEILFHSIPKECAHTVQACKSIMVSGLGSFFGQMLCGTCYKSLDLITAYKIMIIFPIIAISLALPSSTKKVSNSRNEL